MIITIDGPTASGKSTIARLLAEKKDFYYINTGLLYRAIAFLLMQEKEYTYEMLASPEQQDVQAIIERGQLKYSYNRDPHIAFNNQDITKHLKDPAIDKGASIVSSVPFVRDMLLGFQRDIAQHHNVVVEGRDTGSVVFPCAEFKFYLTADISVRAQRWLDMQQQRGNVVTLQEAMRNIQERDERDTQREIAPLVIPQRAIIIDNSQMSEHETLQAFLQAIHAED